MQLSNVCLDNPLQYRFALILGRAEIISRYRPASWNSNRITIQSEHPISNFELWNPCSGRFVKISFQIFFFIFFFFLLKIFFVLSNFSNETIWIVEYTRDCINRWETFHTNVRFIIIRVLSFLGKENRIFFHFSFLLSWKDIQNGYPCLYCIVIDVIILPIFLDISPTITEIPRSILNSRYFNIFYTLVSYTHGLILSP